MEKIFKLRQYLSIEDTARRLSYSFQEEVLPTDVLNLVMESQLKISWLHGPIWVEEVAYVTGLFGNWFGKENIKHNSNLNLEELFSADGEHDLRCIFEHWLSGFEHPDDESLSPEEEMEALDEWYRSKESDFQELKKIVNAKPHADYWELVDLQELREDQKDLLSLINASYVFRTRQDYYWFRFNPSRTSEIARVLTSNESKSQYTDLIPISEVKKIGGGVSRISAHSADFAQWVWANIHNRANEYRADHAADISDGFGTVLEGPDGALIRVKECPFGKYFYRDDSSEYPRIAPELHELVFLRSDIEEFERALDSSGSKQQSAPITAELNPLEKKSLQKMVLGMAIARYGYKPGTLRNNATGENKGSIVVDLQTNGLDVDPDTIRKHLKEAEHHLVNPVR